MTSLVARLLAPVLLGFAALAANASAPFDEGIEYQAIVPPQPTESTGKVEVVELFWYGCPHCYQLEPDLEAWLARKPDNVEFRRVPAVLNRHWALHARAYYAAEVLGAVERIHVPLFKAIHEQRRRLNSVDALAAFFVEQGVAEDQFRKAMASFAVELKVKRAQRVSRAYGIEGVPSIVVNGRYRTNATLANGQRGMFQVIDYLVAREQAQIQAAATQPAGH